MAFETSTGIKNTKLLGLGAYRPERIVTNHEIVEKIDSSDEWIFSRTGIKSRHFANDSESVLNMAVTASKKAITASGLDTKEVDAVILATSTYPDIVPHGAPKIATNLGINGVPAFDLTAGCAGFGYALNVADSLIKAGSARHVLVVAAERMSDSLDMTDRTTCFLFGDGAGAVVVGPSENAEISPGVWGSDGEQSSAIGQSLNLLEVFENLEVRPYLVMDGVKVFRWAAFEMGKIAAEIIKKAGIENEDLNVLIPHQANSRINELLAKSLNLTEKAVLANDIETTGNTSSASIPLAMEEIIRSGKAKPGEKALILGYGSGLSYAGQIVTLPPISE